MPLSLDQFAQQLTESGLLTADEVAAFRAESYAVEAEQFARELVKQKKLTAYQAQQAYSGKARTLVMGNYIILDKLGQGGMGMVLKAQHRRMQRTVALKVLSPAITRSKEAIARFHREVQAAARLEHPNIVIAFDADESNNTHFLVMQYVNGKDLSSIIKGKGPLPVERAVHCILQAARGLEYAHKRGVIHRDIKPANLLVDGDGTVKILDMGLARIEGDVGAQADLTSTGTVMGTIDYMAPEQALSTKSADARSDIYSLGISLWYLIVGRPAFDGDTLMARMLAHREASIPSLAAALAGKGGDSALVQSVNAVFQKMVAKKPEHRYQSMTEVVAALESCLRGERIEAPSISGGPSEDTQFSAFLAGLEQTDAGLQPSRSRRGSATAVSSDEVQVTQNVSSADAATSAQLPGSRARSGVAPRAVPVKLPWWQDRRVQISGGVCGLLLLPTLWFAFGRSSKPLPAPAANTEQVQIASTASRTAPQIPALAAPPKVDYALEFHGGDRVDFTSVPSYDPVNMTLEAVVRIDEHSPRALFCGISERNGLGFDNDDGHFFRYMHKMEAGGWAAMQTYTPLVLQRRYHIAAVCTPAQFRLYVDGKKAAQLPADNKRVLRGQRPAEFGGLFTGQLDEVRISSVPRYTADFTPPARHASDEHTLALYHCDEGQGEVLIDSSSHQRHGKITGAKWVPVSSAGRSTPPAIATAAAEAFGPWINLFEGFYSNQWQSLGPFRVDQRLLIASERGLAVTGEEFADFELEFEWKISPGGNSGIYYHNPAAFLTNHSQAGIEYQLVDNAGHPNGKNPATSAGALYSLVPPSSDVTLPPGQFNSSRIVARGSVVEHWLNGTKVLTYDSSSAEFQTKVQTTKFAPRFESTDGLRGPIALQGNVGTVTFRKIRIRRINKPPAPTDMTELFNGKGLSGWTGDLQAFAVENGTLIATGERGDLITAKEYRDFELQLDFRLSDKANNGIGIRYSGKDRPRLNGMEVQLVDGPNTPSDVPTERCGGLMQLAPPKAQPFQRWPAWNTLRVRCLGRQVHVEMNGVTTVDISTTELSKSFPNHVGLQRSSGYICLITTQGRAEYRNIRVRELTADARPD